MSRACGDGKFLITLSPTLNNLVLQLKESMEDNEDEDEEYYDDEEYVAVDEEEEEGHGP
jgi:hypothetical protein